jgi:hypothetical protein
MQAAAEVPASREFVDEVAAVWDELGYPRLAGRVLGELLVADAPALSTGELCERLPASKGHLSVTLHFLTSLQLVDRVSVPGSRRDYYRLSQDAWLKSWQHGFQYLQRLRDVAGRALDHSPADDAPTRRLADMHDFYSFLLERMPQLAAEFTTRKLPRLRGPAVSRPARKPRSGT